MHGCRTAVLAGGLKGHDGGHERARGCLHARSRGFRPSIPPLAYGGELGRVPAPPAPRGRARILDVGCGPGTITVDLARIAASGSVVGLDRSEDVIGEARATAQRAGVSNVEFGVGDVYALDHEDRHLRRRTRPSGAPAPQRPRRRAARDGAGLQARRDSSRSATATTRRSPGGPPYPSSTSGSISTVRWRGGMTRNPTPVVG